MNLLKRLFSHHSQSQSAPSPFISWGGQSGNHTCRRQSVNTVNRPYERWVASLRGSACLSEYV